jgi:hypothetical protein
MTRLDALCPLCPWNHALAFAAAWAARSTAATAVNAHGAADDSAASALPDRALLARLAARSLAWGLAAAAAWWFGSGR